MQQSARYELRWNHGIGPLLLLAMLFTTIGCKLGKQPSPTGEDVAQLRRERADVASVHIDARREAAQIQAALSEWEHENPAEGVRILDSVLRTNPQNQEARLLIAEMQLVLRQPESALEYLTPLLETAANPRAEYTAGLIYEALHRSEDAQFAFARAVALDPQNEIYQSSYDVAADTSTDTVQAAARTELPAHAVSSESATAVAETLEQYEQLLAAGEIEQAKLLACQLIVRGELDSKSANRLLTATLNSAPTAQ